MNIFLTMLIVVAFAFGGAALEVGFYFYMVHGEGKIMMPVGAILVALGILGIILI